MGDRDCREAPAADSIDVALPRPPVKLSARVSSSGRKRVLSWKLATVKGQTVTFVERGPEAARKITTTSRARGTVTFTPSPYSGGARTVRAIVTQDGLPRASLDVARFTAPKPLRLRRPASLRRRGAKVSWRRQAAAASYSIAFRASDGTIAGSLTTARSSAKVPRRLARRSFTLLVSAKGADDRVSIIASKSFRAPKPRR